MSFKRTVVAHSPAPLVRIAKGIQTLGRLRSANVRIKELLNSGRPIMLELGSGSKRGANGWTTLDVVPGCDVYCDLTKGIPFPDNIVGAIYSSHLFEHLSFKEAQILLDECMRVLVPGGRFSICVPNGRLYLQAYINNELLDEKQFVYAPAFNHTTGIDYVNYVAYMDGHHKYMFDEENLVFILRKKGFTKVRLREFDASIDSKEREFESIYAEGVKVEKAP